MSVEAIHGEHPHNDDPHLTFAHHFIERKQQDESYIVGMWAFLVTEIMFFGALFIAYIVYRTIWPGEFAEFSRSHLNTFLGFINTLILLSSSLSMAFCVRHAKLKNHGKMVACMMLTFLFACGFLVVKTVEYTSKYNLNLIPGPLFHYTAGEAEAKGEGAASAEKAEAGGAEVKAEAHERKNILPAAKGQRDTKQRHAEIFYSLYFIMTGIHGIHVVIGMLAMVIILVMFWFGSPLVQDFMPIEMFGLYWHFVDIVWIFLYPALYLINPDITKFHP